MKRHRFGPIRAMCYVLALRHHVLGARMHGYSMYDLCIRQMLWSIPPLLASAERSASGMRPKSSRRVSRDLDLTRCHHRNDAGSADGSTSHNLQSNFVTNPFRRLRNAGPLIHRGSGRAANLTAALAA